MNDNTFEVPNNSKDASISVAIDWYIPYIHKVWNIKSIYISGNRSNGNYVNWTYE